MRKDKQHVERKHQQALEVRLLAATDLLDARDAVAGAKFDFDLLLRNSDKFARKPACGPTGLARVLNGPLAGHLSSTERVKLARDMIVVYSTTAELRRLDLETAEKDLRLAEHDANKFSIGAASESATRRGVGAKPSRNSA